MSYLQKCDRAKRRNGDKSLINEVWTKQEPNKNQTRTKPILTIYFNYDGHVLKCTELRKSPNPILARDDIYLFPLLL